MARYTGPITKKSRRLKVDLVGGDKNFENRPFPPGQHGRGRIQEKEYLHQLQILESRLDNVVYRAGLARTRRAARQLVTHGHFLVNGVRVDVPSYRVSEYDIIDIRPKSRDTFPIELARQTFGERPVPAWMKVVPGTLQILIHSLPVRAQIDTVLTEQLIVELYSKN